MGKCLMSDFYCTQCGAKGIPVWRKPGKAREKGHLKKLFCLKCAKETNHIEIKHNSTYNLDAFIKEFEYGNFKDDGTREYTLGELEVMIENGKIKKQKTFYNGRSGGSR